LPFFLGWRFLARHHTDAPFHQHHDGLHFPGHNIYITNGIKKIVILQGVDFLGGPAGKDGAKEDSLGKRSTHYWNFASNAVSTRLAAVLII
jgi:hypothetical protein